MRPIGHECRGPEPPGQRSEHSSCRAAFRTTRCSVTAGNGACAMTAPPAAFPVRTSMRSPRGNAVAARRGCGSPCSTRASIPRIPTCAAPRATALASRAGSTSRRSSRVHGPTRPRTAPRSRASWRRSRTMAHTSIRSVSPVCAAATVRATLAAASSPSRFRPGTPRVPRPMTSPAGSLPRWPRARAR